MPSMTPERKTAAQPRRPIRLVVGGNRGIGLALVAAQLNDPGVETLMVTHRTGADLSRLEALDRQFPGKLKLHALDVCRAADLAGFADRLAQMENGIDLAIHAAGILHEQLEEDQDHASD